MQVGLNWHLDLEKSRHQRMRLITTYSAVSTGDGLYSPAGRAAAVALASMQLGDGHKIRSNTSMAMEGMHNLNSPEL